MAAATLKDSCRLFRLAGAAAVKDSRKKEQAETEKQLKSAVFYFSFCMGRIRQVSIPNAMLRESRLAGAVFCLFISLLRQNETSPSIEIIQNGTPFFNEI
ncbi:hypothetical protein [Methanimicrococcus hongohii]|uniref:hypothetical protein n=1 Tax=Methanimicrococcus hongohii TaxID=3028295 RepID=UPI002930B3CF|nr:hypothetical protein [Methanimicrococcus sp. Hf6]